MARRCSVERANKQIGGFASAKKNMVIQYEGLHWMPQNIANRF